MKKFSDWFPQVQAEIKAQAAELEAQVRQKNLNALPASQINALSQQIDSLSSPFPYLHTVKSRLSEAIAVWQEEENAPNSLVVLGSPIAPFAQIFKQLLADWQAENPLQFQSLSWSNRPGDHSTIKSQLAEVIASCRDISEQDNSTILIIPDLTWCFLRCVDGLDAIEYLQELLFCDRSFFWLIGCNSWTWEYLDIIGNFSDYFQQTLYLPALKDIELKEWLAPVHETLELHFSGNQVKQNNHQELDEQDKCDWESASQQSYYEHLSKISLGLSQVASRLWLLSLGIEEEQSEDEDSEDLENKDENESSAQIILQKIVLPDLPTLTKDDRYLLFSLCLHGEMTLSELALSLGEEEIQVQNQFQNLCNSGVIEQRNNFFHINPVYYPQLKRDLSDNNFLVKGEQ